MGASNGAGAESRGECALNRLLVLFFVSAVDVLGFGIMIPLIPYMGDRFGATPAEITWTLAAYSVCQFIAAPIWGRISDRYGRRPVLIIGLIGACIGYLILAYATSLTGLYVSRIVGGLMAGNISAALAYASDVSAPKDRAKSLGMIGAAIGIGFMLGPAIGGALAGSDPATANFALPAFVSCGLAILAMLLVFFVLPESRSAEQRIAGAAVAGDRSPLALLAKLPRLRAIVIAAVLVISAQAILESISALWAFKRFGFGPRDAGLLLLTLAMVAVIMQGGLVRVLVPKFGEQKLAIFGATAYVLGLIIVAFAPVFAIAVLGLLFCGAGIGAYQPSASSLASRQSDESNRGAVMGTFQAASSLARIIGPTISGPIFGIWGASAPFLVAVAFVAPAIFILLNLPATQQSES